MSVDIERVRRLCKTAFASVREQDVRIMVHARSSGYRRFASALGPAGPTHAGETEALHIDIAVAQPGRAAATVGISTLDAAAVREATIRARDLAAQMPQDPEAMPMLGRAAGSVSQHAKPSFPAARQAALDQLERTVLDPVAMGKTVDLTLAGFAESAHVTRVFADRAGAFAYHAQHQARLSLTARTADGTGSGRAAVQSSDMGQLDGAAVVAEACARARASASPRPVEAGPSRVLLMPLAVAELLAFFCDNMHLRPAAQGRSAFAPSGDAPMFGRMFAHESLTLASDPSHPMAPTWPFAPTGESHPKVTWIESGKLMALPSSRYFANTYGVAPIPTPSSLHLASNTPTDDLLAALGTGLLVHAFWYTRLLDPATLRLTGITRDGVFSVKDGKIQHPVHNLRYNDGPLTLLRNVVAAGRPQQAAFGDDPVFIVPPMVVDGFHFESTTAAV